MDGPERQKVQPILYTNHVLYEARGTLAPIGQERVRSIQLKDFGLYNPITGHQRCREGIEHIEPRNKPVSSEVRQHLLRYTREYPMGIIWIHREEEQNG